jgi:crossover junction endodeoxyribonuclease RuvC
MAIEEAFYHKNVRTAMILGHARAAAILASVNSSVEVSEYSPLKIKQAVVGTGSASKEQVQFMVKTILNLDEKPTPNDAADGLAVAICHINRSRFQNALKIR